MSTKGNETLLMTLTIFFVGVLNSAIQVNTKYFQSIALHSTDYCRRLVDDIRSNLLLIFANMNYYCIERIIIVQCLISFVLSYSISRMPIKIVVLIPYPTTEFLNQQSVGIQTVYVQKLK